MANKDPLDYWKNIAWNDETKPKPFREAMVEFVERFNLVEYVPYWPNPLQVAFRERMQLEGLLGGEPRASKTTAVLIDNVCDSTVEGFTSIFFRRTLAELKRKNGLIDTLRQWFQPFPEWTWSEELMEWRNKKYNSAFIFAFLGQRGDEDNLLGFEFQRMNFEELTRLPFTTDWNPYLDLGHRLNVPIGMPVRRKVRATANPGGEGEGWVMDRFLSPMAERFDIGGNGSYMLIQQQRPHPNPEQEFGGIFYIHAQIEDNKAVNAHDYRAGMNPMRDVKKQQFAHGMWGVTEKGGIIDRSKIREVPTMPWNVMARMRSWDKASSEAPKNVNVKRLPPRTAGVRVSRLMPGAALAMWGKEFADIEFVIEHAIAGYWVPFLREDMIDKIAGGGQVYIKDNSLVYWGGDGFQTIIVHEQEPGSGGLESAEATTRRLLRLGYNISHVKSVYNKEARVAPLAATVGRGMYGIVVDGTYDHEEFLAELAGFPKNPRKDYPDATGLAHGELTKLVPDYGAVFGGEGALDMTGFSPYSGAETDQRLANAIAGMRGFSF